MILSHRAGALEYRGTVDTAHVHRAALHNLVIYSHWLTVVVKDVFFNHSFRLGLINRNETGRGEMIMARSHDIFSFDGG